MGPKIEDLQGNIFEILEYRDLIKKVPIFPHWDLIYTSDILTGKDFTLMQSPTGEWEALINLGKAWDYLYLRVTLKHIKYNPQNDIRKAYLYGKSKKTTKTLRNY